MAQADGENRLFVTRIAPHITQQDVAAHFAQFGTTTDVYLPGVPGRPGHKGIAFVSFSEPTSIQVAMSNSPHLINGGEVVVDIAAPRGQKPDGGPGASREAHGPPPGSSGDRLFVTKVPSTMNRDHIEKHFSQFGEITDCYMPSVPGSGTHKGIAFVSFVDPASVHVALQHPSHEIDGVLVVVDLAAPRGAVGKGGQASAGAPNPQALQNAALNQMQALQMQNLQGMNLQGLMGQMGLGQMGQMGQMGLVAPQSVPAVGGSSGQPVPGRLFLTKVPQEVTKADLEAYFGQFGELADVYVHGKGIAFVSLKDPLVSQQILQNKEHFVKPGVSVLVDQALDRPAKGNGEGKGGRGAPVQNLQMMQPVAFPGAFGMMDPAFQGLYQQQAAGMMRFNPY